LLQVSVRDNSHITTSEGTDRMIGETENKGVEVGQVARELERMNLPTSIRKKLIAAGKAAQDKRAVIRRRAILHNIIMARDLPACAN
jgi:hypothetical protein